MYFHRCEGKIYTQKEATKHPHAKNAYDCLLGWRMATEKEIAKSKKARKAAA